LQRRSESNFDLHSEGSSRISWPEDGFLNLQCSDYKAGVLTSRPPSLDKTVYYRSSLLLYFQNDRLWNTLKYCVRDLFTWLYLFKTQFSIWLILSSSLLGTTRFKSSKMLPRIYFKFAPWNSLNYYSRPISINIVVVVRFLKLGLSNTSRIYLLIIII